MALLLRLSVLASMMLGMVFLEFFADRTGLHLPWYFLLEVVMGVIPMTWLLIEVMPKAKPSERLAFITTSAIFIIAASIAELIAIQSRFWWFYQGLDKLTGLKMGDIPLEEFFFYPLFLNLPVLFYLYLRRYMPEAAPPKPLGDRARKYVRLAGWVLLAAGAALLVKALFTTTPPLDLTIQPADDGSGAIRYSAGPAQHGWTIVQAFGMSICAFMYAAYADRVGKRRLVLTVALFFVLGFFFELMGCGRGWWVWNEQQVIGIFTWVLPIDSYSMYFTGGLMPILTFEALHPFFVGAPAEEPSPSLAAT